MSDETYEAKRQSLQQYVPYLEDIISKLEAKETQKAVLLERIKNIHFMITETSEKVNLENLNICAKVLKNIFPRANSHQLLTKARSTSIENPKNKPADEEDFEIQIDTRPQPSKNTTNSSVLSSKVAATRSSIVPATSIKVKTEYRDEDIIEIESDSDEDEIIFDFIDRAMATFPIPFLDNKHLTSSCKQQERTRWSGRNDFDERREKKAKMAQEQNLIIKIEDDDVKDVIKTDIKVSTDKGAIRLRDSGEMVESRNIIEANKSQEATSSKNSSTEILQIVKNALDAQKNQDESSRICSVLEIFLGKLHSNQVERIRNIFSKEEADKVKNPESNETQKEHQQPVSNSNKDLPTSITNSNETQVNEVSKSMEHSEVEKLCNQANLEPEPIEVSVDERIENRKSIPQIAAAAQKTNTELDLHADIQATAKRNCAQKNDSNVLPIPAEQQSVKLSSLEESERGGKRKATDNNISEAPIRKQMKVSIKLPKEILNALALRQTSMAERDASKNVSPDHNVSEFEEEPSKEQPRPKRKKLAKWAAGITSKSKKKKSQESKSKESSPVPSTSEAASLSDNENPLEPDINYYYDYTTKTKLNCKLCQYSGHSMTAHYLKEHPESEVLNSRLSPQAAAKAIEDFASNEENYKNAANKKLLRRKFYYSCRMCNYARLIGTKYFYNHVSSHTGEYRQKCGICEYTVLSKTSLSGHYLNFHPEIYRSETTATKHAIVFGYMCSECNFVQLKEKNLQNHVKAHHKSTIHKINMSSILDVVGKKVVSKSQDDLTVKINTTRIRKSMAQIHNAGLSDRASTKSGNLRKRKASVCEETTALQFKSKAATSAFSKKRQKLDALIKGYKNKDDLNEVIYFSSRRTRAAKEKANATLKSLIEHEELGSVNENVDQESSAESYEKETSDRESIVVREESDDEPIDVPRGGRDETLVEDSDAFEKDPEDFLNTTKEDLEMPILKKYFMASNIETPPFQKSPTPEIIETSEIEEQSSIETRSIKFRQNKVNSLFSSTIEKLQGKIKEAVQGDSSKENDNVELPITEDEASNGEVSDSFISIGDLIRATKIGSEILYSCHVNQCNFTSKDKRIFKIHCKHDIHRNLQVTSWLCDRCGVIVTITEDSTFLENLYDHLVFAHSDFISPMSLVRICRLSVDELSIKKEKKSKTEELNQQIAKEIVPLQDMEKEIAMVSITSKSNTSSSPLSENCPPLQMLSDREVTSINKEPSTAIIIEPTEDTSYGFKIVDVISLANSDPSSNAPPMEPVAAAITKPPPVVLVNEEEPTLQPKLVREVKLTSLEANRPRKCAKALQSLIIESLNNLYKCPHFNCKFSTNVRTMFVFHLKEHTSDKTAMVPCVYCDVKTPWDHVPMHIDIRHASSRHTCRHCLYRAVAPQYVSLHQEQCHPYQDFIVISVPPHEAAKKFYAADVEIDCKQLCEPFRCVCENEEGILKSHEYLFGNEFVKHLKVHKRGSIQCGYPKCDEKLDASSMLNHWAIVHKVRTYQCSYCKVNSEDIRLLFRHFAKVHPNMMPNILVRKNDSLKKHPKEVKYTNDAFLYLGYIRKFPPNIKSIMKNRSKCKKIRIIESDDGNTAEESTVALPPPKTSPSETLSLPIPQNNSQLLLTHPNAQLLSSTSTNDKVLLISSTSMVSQAKIPSVTSTATIGKVLCQTSTASTASTSRPRQVLVQIPRSSITVPIKVESQTSTASSTVTLNPQAPVRFQDVSEDNQGPLTTTASASAPVSGNRFNTSSATSTEPIESQQEVANSAIKTENDIAILTDDADHISQSAMPNILDFDNDSNSRTPLGPEPLSQSSPPSKMFSNTNTSNSNSSLQNKEPAMKVLAPIEHINVNEQQEDLLQLESNGVSVSEFIGDDNLRSEGPLNLISELVLNLEARITESLEPSSVETVPSLMPQKLGGSFVEYTIDKFDKSSTLEKEIRGLSGYQLYRCSTCNLSFATFQVFKKHLFNSMTCKKPGPKSYQCAHCCKGFIKPIRLAKHIFSHGVLRFFCGLCNKKFGTVESTKLHMKTRHSIFQCKMAPLKPDKNDLEVDEFMFIPRKENEVATCAPKLATDTDTSTFNPDEIDSIPIRQIFNTNVKCGKCNFQTKVRLNIIRHLKMHLDEKAVPDTAPVNPVPCLEKNEKMFDKTCNLAASSFPTGRMGGLPAVKEKDQEKYPEFVPSHSRFVCCAQGCSYLCPEESNLKHHIMALHSDETGFTCAHCKVAIDSSDVENVIKHFKLHGLYLYKCQYCSFVHNLKHKVGKHILDDHPDLAVKVITLRYMDSEPEFTVEHHNVVAPQSVTSQPKFKPWSCCMCKVKYHTKDEILTHIVKKHNIDAQYKCTLCAFKDDQENVCREHFKEKHPDNVFDIILVYRETEEETVREDTSLAAFDKTRHTREILLSPSRKSPEKTNFPPKINVLSVATFPDLAEKTINISPANKAIVSKNLIDSIKAVANVDDSGIECEQQESVVEVQDSNLNSTSSSKGQNRPETTDRLQEAVKMPRIDETSDASTADRCSRENLVQMFGAIGDPDNEKLKCPRCSTFRSKKAENFIFHLHQEFNFKRYRCESCDHSNVSYQLMLEHIRMYHPNATEDLIRSQTSYIEFDTWIRMVLKEQSEKILNQLEKQHVADSFENKCYFCNDSFISPSECHEHMLYHWVMMPYQCHHCLQEFYIVHDLRHHHSIEHPDLVLYAEPKGPTLSQALDCIENTRKRVKTYSALIEKKAPLEESESRKQPITSGMVINALEVKKLIGSDDSEATNGDQVFACEMCAYYGYSETNIKQHLQNIHQITINKFHMTTNDKSDSVFAMKMACNICDEIFTELELRQHFLELHKESEFVPYIFKCLSCRMKFFEVEQVRTHCIEYHPMAKPSYECALTKNKFAVRKATGKRKKFPCSLCSFVSISLTRYSIKWHVRGHFKPFVCNICQNNFRDRPDIVKHTERKHRGFEVNFRKCSDLDEQCNKVVDDICNAAVPMEDISTEEASTSEAPIASSSKMPCAEKSTDQEEEEVNGGDRYYVVTAKKMREMNNSDVVFDLSVCLMDENNATESS